MKRSRAKSSTKEESARDFRGHLSVSSSTRGPYIRCPVGIYLRGGEYVHVVLRVAEQSGSFAGERGDHHGVTGGRGTF